MWCNGNTSVSKTENEGSTPSTYAKARVMELVDITDLKSVGPRPWEFESPRPHQNPHFMCRKSLNHKQCVNHVAWSVEQIAQQNRGIICAMP